MAEDAIKNLPRLYMRDICKRFGATIALEHVTFDISPGEVHALVGENGAGKSTLMKILSGAYKADSGEMLLNGVAYRPNNPLEARHKGVGMIYQELSLAPHLTVEENIVLGMEPNTFGFIHRKEVRKHAEAAMQKFEHSDIKPNTRVKDLSVSAQQLVEIGRALALGCNILVFDEPTSSLSQKDIKRLFDIIRDLKSQGLSIVYISHFLEEVQHVADRLTVLRDGSVTGCSVVTQVTTDEIVRMMVGREVKELYARTSRKPGRTVLEIEDLSSTSRFESASLTLHEGEVVGIVGLVGAGRTELLRAIFGLDPVRTGKIKIGIYTGPGSPIKRWLHGTGYLSENRKEEGLALNLSIADNMTLTKLDSSGPLGLISPKKLQTSTQKWIDRLDIRCQAPRQRTDALSGGNQQKVALARLLHHDVDVFLLDEPTRGVDVAAKAKIYQIIDEMATGSVKEGRPPKSVLIVSSYIPELIGVCDRVAAMCRGRLGELHNVRDVNEHMLMLAAMGKESN